MNLYPVTVNWMLGLPEKPYRGGVGAYEGVVMHQTANPNDSAAGERAWESKHFNDAFVHEFIDPDFIVQVANPAYLAFGAGRYANQRFVHLELCSAKTNEEFERSFDMWCQRAAVHLAARQLGVSNAQPDGSGTLWGHFQVSQYLGGTDHMDPIDYLQQWGRTWDDVLQRVQQHYDHITKGDEPEMKPEDANKVIGLLQEAFRQGVTKITLPDQSVVTLDDNEIHRLANVQRKASGQPEQ